MIYWKCGFDLSRVPVSIGRFPSKVVRPSRWWLVVGGWLVDLMEQRCNFKGVYKQLCVYIHIYNHHHCDVLWVGLVPVYGIPTKSILFSNSVYILLRVYLYKGEETINDQMIKRGSEISEYRIPVLASFRLPPIKSGYSDRWKRSDTIRDGT